MVANNDKAVEISAKEFDEVVNEKKITLIDFYAEWCMPCLMLAPVFEELAAKLKEIKFVKVNVDENRELSSKFNISSIPCIVILKNGEEINRINGSLPEEVLEEKIRKYLN